MNRRNLVIVRAGKASLHAGWLEHGEKRTWDILVSYYDHAAFDVAQAAGAAEPMVFMSGGKWPGIFTELSGTDLIDRYDYFLFPDDDIEASAADIDAIFRIAGERRLAVSQPALSADSFFSHFITRACPAFALRYTDFVEIMVPCLDRDTLKRALPLFRETRSGFGLDFLWHRLAADNRQKAAIIDSVVVRHTRQVSNSAQRAAANGVPAEVEMAALLAQFQVAPKLRPVIYAGLTTDGRLISGGPRLWFAAALSYARAEGRRLLDRRRLRQFLRWLQQQLTVSPKLDQVKARTA